MFPRTVELAFRRFQKHGDARALAIVFDRTAPELLGLARHLAPVGTEAEDLVQETFVTAIKDAASHRPPQRVLPWLLGILNNHARAARRQQRRNLDEGRLREVGAFVPIDVHTEVEAGERQRELRAAIDRLPEVYRPVLRLVVEHGLAAHEIAKALERPAGTVRAQIARGLELLRRALPASLAGSAAIAVGTGRGLAAVRQAVLSHSGVASTGFFSALAIGGLLMLQPKLMAALAAALLVVFGFVWFDRAPPAPQAVDAAATGTTSSAALDPAVSAASPQRTSVEPPALTAAPAPAAAAASAPTPTEGVLVVRLRGPDGKPVPGVAIAVFPASNLQDLGRHLVHTPSNEAGEVRFPGLDPMQWAIDIDRLGLAGFVDTVAGETIVREVDLPPGVRVEGRVVDRRGNPVAGASVVLHGSRAGTALLATSDAKGAFAVDFLTPGVELQARRAGREPSLAHTVNAKAGASTAVLLVLELVLGDGARTLRGRVFDQAGHALAGAIVAILPDAAADHAPHEPDQPQVRAHWQRTDGDGNFVCDEVGIGVQLVYAHSFARGSAPAWVSADTSSGDPFVELRLPRAATLHGTVRRDGEVVGLQVLAWPQTEPRIGYLLNLFGMRHTTIAADGTFQMTGLWAGKQRLRLLQGMTTLAEATLELRAGEAATWHNDLSATTELSIRVLCSASLHPHRLVAMVSNTELRNGEAPSLAPVQKDGTALHTAARSGAVDVVITCMPGGRSILQLARVRAVPPTQSALEIVLQPHELPSRTITGRLVDAQKAPLARATVVAQRADASGLMVRCETTTASDGAFVLGPLPAGDYALLEGPMQSPRNIGRATVTAARDESVGDVEAGARND